MKALALSVVLSCSGSQPAEPPATVPVSNPPAAEPAVSEPAVAEPAPGTKAPVPPGEPPAEAAAPATASQSVTKTLFVAEALADCQGEAPQQCLRVRESQAEPYHNFYSSIAGFDYEPSHVYELRVEATPVANAPADSSAVRYRLIEVVSKRKVPAAKGKP